MPLPDTKEELEAAGYVFDNEAKCRGATCGAMIEWWIAPGPKKKLLPMSVVEVRRMEAGPNNSFFAPVIQYKRILHFIDCPDRKDFRKGGNK